MYIVRILIYWYTTKNVCTLKTYHNINNSDRQEEILSPYLVCVYMDDLSIKLNKVMLDV